MVAALAGCGGEPSNPDPAPPNFLLIVTDDQRWDTLFAMPHLAASLGRDALRFDNAFVTNPVCCPFRSSLLAGGFPSHQTGVLTATPLNGAAARFDDSETLATLLSRRGYRTGLIGKYLNFYDQIAPRVPPGWNRFMVATTPYRWWNTEWIVGASGVDGPAEGQRQTTGAYITYVEAEAALAFLDEASAGEPFFLLVATHAPHRPAIPPQADDGRWRDFSYRARAFDEEDLADKPDYVRRREDFFHQHNAESGLVGVLPRGQLEALGAVDRMVRDLMVRLEERGLADNTVVVFTSDNGMLWGEHRLFTKSLPYEESIRVPLLMRLPGVAPRVMTELVAVDLDLAATLLDLAGIERPAEGRSLLPLAEGHGAGWRDALRFENFGVDPDVVPPWVALRTDRWKYVEYATGERELYDLEDDPFELDNRVAGPRVADAERTAERLAARLGGFRGLAMADSSRLPEARLGESWSHPLTAVGGTGERSWRVLEGRLPAGLTLQADGRIAGTPTRPGSFRALVEVSDESVSPVTGREQSYRRWFDIRVSR